MAELMTAEKQVFISYAPGDDEIADRLQRLLRSAGLKVSYDADDIVVGSNWGDAVLAALKASDAVVFVVPRREGEGLFALQEAGAAKALGKPIISVISDPLRYVNGAIGVSLSGRALIDASRLSDIELTRTLQAALA